MDITFIRSSLLGSIDYCELKTYIIYSLGIQDSVNMKTVKGTICHKVIEILALFKKKYQETGEKIITIVDDTMGEYSVHYDDLMSEDWLTEEEIVKINKTRKNQQTFGPNSPGYIDCIQLKFPHKQYGREVVNQLIEDVYTHFSNKHSEFGWKPIDLKDVRNYVWIGLDTNNGAFDPRRREVFGTEQSFEITIDDPWAAYEYEHDDDQICGQLKIKGTVDLIFKIDDETLEVNDWKFGQRINWATKEVKDLAKLEKDPQLMLYYYALRKLFPQYKNIILSIFFARDGGPFSVCFEDHHITDMHNFLRQRFDFIKNLKEPKMLDPTQQDFRCKRLCPFYKQEIGGTNYCKHIHDSIKTLGLDTVTKLHKRANFNIDYYQNPGE